MMFIKLKQSFLHDLRKLLGDLLVSQSTIEPFHKKSILYFHNQLLIEIDKLDVDYYNKNNKPEKKLKYIDDCVLVPEPIYNTLMSMATSSDMTVTIMKETGMGEAEASIINEKFKSAKEIMKNISNDED